MLKALLSSLLIASFGAFHLAAQEVAPAETALEIPLEVPVIPAETTEAAPTEEPPLELLPSSPDQVLPPPSLTTEPLPLIPEAPESNEKPRGETQREVRKEKLSKTEAANNEMNARIRFREVRTRVVQDPALQVIWDEANRAPTDYEKRETLKRYYKMLYGRMAKIDRSLKKEIVLREELALKRLTQKRIDPTDPFVSDERIERLEDR